MGNQNEEFNGASVQNKVLDAAKAQTAEKKKGFDEKDPFWMEVVDIERKFYESKSKRERNKILDVMQEREEAILAKLERIKEIQISPNDAARKERLAAEYRSTYLMWDELTTKRQGMEDNFLNFEAKVPKAKTSGNVPTMVSVAETPVKEAPVETTPVAEVPAQKAPVVETPTESVPVETPVEKKTQEEKAPAAETPAEKTVKEPKVSVKDLHYTQPTLTIPDAGETFGDVYVEQKPQKARKDNFAKVGCGILGVLLIAGAIMAAYHFKPFNNEKDNSKSKTVENKDTIQQVVNNENTAVQETAPVEEISTPKVEAKEEDVIVIESKDVVAQEAESQTDDNAPKATPVEDDKTPKAVPVVSVEEAAALEAEAKKAEAERVKAEAIVEPAPTEEVVPEVVADEKTEEVVVPPTQTTINIENGIFGDVSIVNNYTTNNNGDTIVIEADERGVMISPDGMVVVPGKAKAEAVEEVQQAPVETEQVNDEEDAEYFRIENERSSRHVTSKGDVVEQSSYRVITRDGNVFNVSESKRNGEVVNRVIRERKVRERY